MKSYVMVHIWVTEADVKITLSKSMRMPDKIMALLM